MEEEKVLDETQKEVVAQEDSDDANVDEDDDIVTDEDIEDEDEEEDDESLDSDEDEQAEESDEGQTEDGAANTPEVKPEQQPVVKPVQSPEENAKYAALRKKWDAQERESRDKLNSLVAKSGYKSYDEMMNSTGFPESEEQRLRQEAQSFGYDEEEYLEEQLNKSFIKKMRQRDEAIRLKAAAEQAVKDRIQSDIDAFAKNYPSVSLVELLNNERFAKFAKGKTETQPLTEIYTDFVELFGVVQMEVAKKVSSKSQRSTGSGTSTSVSLTANQQRLMREWNRSHPNNPMKPEDFAD